MITKTSTSWYVKDTNGNNTYGHEGYSKYYERLNAERKNLLLPNELVYGYQQAVEHAMELKNRQHGLFLSVCSITTVETSIII